MEDVEPLSRSSAFFLATLSVGSTNIILKNFRLSLSRNNTVSQSGRYHIIFFTFPRFGMVSLADRHSMQHALQRGLFHSAPPPPITPPHKAARLAAGR